MKNIIVLALLTLAGCSGSLNDSDKITTPPIPRMVYKTIASEGFRGYRLIIVTNPHTRKRYLVLSNVGFNDVVSMVKLEDLEPE